MFKGKATISITELNEIEIKHNDGWVEGNLIQNGDDPYIVGDIVETDKEYIALEWWCPVDPLTIEKIRQRRLSRRLENDSQRNN